MNPRQQRPEVRCADSHVTIIARISVQAAGQGRAKLIPDWRSSFLGWTSEMLTQSQQSHQKTAGSF